MKTGKAAVVIFLAVCCCTKTRDIDYYSKAEIDSLIEAHDTTILRITDYDDSLLTARLEEIQRELNNLPGNDPPIRFPRWGVIANTAIDSIKEFHWKSILPEPEPEPEIPYLDGDLTAISWNANPDSDGVNFYRVFVRNIFNRIDTLYSGPDTCIAIQTDRLSYDTLMFYLKAYDSWRNESAPSDTIKRIRKRE
jgi:hypothetical protein